MTDFQLPALIGMLHIPVNTILAAPESWRESLMLPSPDKADWELINEWNEDIFAVQDDLAVQCLSFYNFLKERMMREAALYQTFSFDCLMLENIAAPYFVRGSQPAVIYGVMMALAKQLRTEFGRARLGLQILAFADGWAMDIACRCGLDFIRCESALFEGVRPEGRTPNFGNLAKLYMTRQLLLSQLGSCGTEPQVYVDVHKKHTVFTGDLNTIELWLDNILFQKIEGVVITGKATGHPVDEDDILLARETIEEVKAVSKSAVGAEWSPLLIIGSGVSEKNISVCKRYADAVIIGSSLKKNGYWECLLEEDRVKKFIEAWHE